MLPKSLEEELFATALDAAQQAGHYILKHSESTPAYTLKSRANMVTLIDRTSEEMIVKSILRRFPDHQILTEEGLNQTCHSDFKWIIDPLDGTTNFVHGFPFYAVSIGLEYQGQIVLGVVNFPIQKELFYARLGQGAYLNQRPISVSAIERLEQSLLATGFPYDLSERFNLNFDLFKIFYRQSQGIRRPGAAAIDLCYVACGRLDGFWEFELNPWDVAAGSIIVKEAGGSLRNIDGTPFSIYDRQILATNGRIENEMLATIKDYFASIRQHS